MKKFDVKDVVERIVSVLPPKRPIEHHAPVFGPSEQSYALDCLSDDPVGYTYIKEFEERLALLAGVNQVLAVNSGTAALHLALMAVGIKPGDEVLVPALTFVATANAVVHAGATPHFVDGSFNLNAYKLRQYLAYNTKKNPDGKGRLNPETDRPITALIVVDLLGIPADWERLTQIAREFDLTLIEDAAEAVGSKQGCKPCGSFGQVAIYSFNCNKIVTTGGGGALLTNDEWVQAKAYQLATTARVQHAYLVAHDAVAWNYRMPNISAALGAAQLRRLSTFLNQKKQLTERYQAKLDGCPGVTFLEQPEGANCWLNALLVDRPSDRDLLFAALHAEGIKARAIFTPLHLLPMFGKCPKSNLGYAEDAANRMVCLPSGAGAV